ncbi:hypothetical protein HanRHA438_Chr09g0382341 [Helianthus annuus]|nr:hypothetical protein HanRHA438_Chr09g0382341 [Helianthus annuus]
MLGGTIISEKNKKMNDRYVSRFINFTKTETRKNRFGYRGISGIN